MDQQEAAAWLRRGWEAQGARRAQEAEACYRKVLEGFPGHPAASALIGSLYLDAGRADLALAPLRQTVAAAPERPQHHLWLGRALYETGDLTGARASLERVAAEQPALAEARVWLGRACADLGDLEGAVTHYRALTELQPAAPRAHLFLGYALQNVGRWDEALAAYDRALELDPDTPDAVAGKATILESRGDRAGALALIGPVARSGAPNGNVALAFLGASKRTPEEADARRYAEETLRAAPLSVERRRILHHRLGDAYHAQKEYDRAFEQYRLGNGSTHQRFDRAGHQRLVDRIIATFGAESLSEMERSGEASAQPVFIVGMPRSGTTLVEQIIDSHPQAAGAGELDTVNVLAHTLRAGMGTAHDYPRGARELNRSGWQSLADRYLAALRAGRDGAARITDKMQHNFLHLGFIQQMLPAARVIHCVRDPRDTCLSCYTQAFIGAHAYSNDLADLGFYYGQYVRLMRHWSAVLTLPVLTVCYEEVVADQEGMTRKIIDFCGLEWDDRCLRFFETGRDVNTASYDQVRRPIYASSVGAWRHYARHLGPLLDALAALPSELLPDEGVLPRFPGPATGASA